MYITKYFFNVITIFSHFSWKAFGKKLQGGLPCLCSLFPEPLTPAWEQTQGTPHTTNAFTLRIDTGKQHVGPHDP